MPLDLIGSSTTASRMFPERHCFLVHADLTSQSAPELPHLSKKFPRNNAAPRHFGSKAGKSRLAAEAPKPTSVAQLP
jgi:hypothetical protein